MGSLVVDSERAGQTLLENDPNSKYPKCQVFDLSIESNEVLSHMPTDFDRLSYQTFIPFLFSVWALACAK